METRTPGISVVIPAFRSSETLPSLVNELEEHVGPLTSCLEIVIVDDGSGDDTWATISALAVGPRRAEVHGIRLLRNFGQHNALLAGLRHATQPLILTIDDDLQHPPDQVRRLIDTLDESIDLVYGRPAEERQSRLRNAASKVTKRTMAGALGSEVYPRSSAFRLFRRELISAGDRVDDPSISIDVLLSWATNRITDIEVDCADRASGTSGYTLRKLVRHAVNMITGYSTRPLRLVSAVGIIVSAFGFATLMYVLARFVLGDAVVAGFTFLAAAITLFSGVQLLSLGIIGEYIGRMHFRSMGKPPYLVGATTRDVCGHNADTDELSDADH